MLRIHLSILLFFGLSTLYGQINPFDSIEVLIDTSVHFETGQYQFDESDYHILNSIVDSCATEKDFQVFIEAHTDHVGNISTNQILSQRRAEAVKNYLEEKGLAANNIELSYFGENRPAANNETEQGRQLNRRAQIKVFRKRMMTYVKGQVVDKKTGEGIFAKVIFHTKTHRDSSFTDSVGNFAKAVIPNTVVGVDVYKKGYFFETEMIKVRLGRSNLLTINLPPAIVGEIIDLKNLYFVGNQAVLLKKSKPQLPKVLKFMQMNDSIKIEIAGHINAPGRSIKQLAPWEKLLSSNRARLVYDYLLQNNIDSTRMRYMGYANTQMRYPRARTEIEMEANRRVEIRILDSGELVSREEKVTIEN